MNLDDLGDVTLVGNFIINGSITGAGSVECDGRVIVEGSVDIDGDFIAEDGAEINGDLLSGGSVESNGDINVNGKVEGLSVISEGDLEVAESVDVDELYVKNNAKIGGDLNCKKFEFGGTAEIFGERNVETEAIESLESILEADNAADMQNTAGPKA